MTFYPCASTGIKIYPFGNISISLESTSPKTGMIEARQVGALRCGIYTK
jgi:hypothetical protein